MSIASEHMVTIDPIYQPFGYFCFVKGKANYSGYKNCECEIKFRYAYKDLSLHVQVIDIDSVGRSYKLSVRIVDGQEMPCLLLGTITYSGEFLLPSNIDGLAHFEPLSGQLSRMLARIIHVLLYAHILCSEDIPRDKSTNKPITTLWWVGFTEPVLSYIQDYSDVLLEDLVISMHALPKPA